MVLPPPFGPSTHITSPASSEKLTSRPIVRPGVYGPAFRETIGENGDLYLFAPFLAPMGALAGAYYR